MTSASRFQVGSILVAQLGEHVDDPSGVAKREPVKIVAVICPGRFVVSFYNDVASLREPVCYGIATDREFWSGKDTVDNRCHAIVHKRYFRGTTLDDVLEDVGIKR